MGKTRLVIPDLYATEAPNVYDKKKAGLNTANTQFRPRLKSRDMAGANRYKCFEGLANQRVI